MPLNLTMLEKVLKFVPIIVTKVPAGPLDGEKEVMAGLVVEEVVSVSGNHSKLPHPVSMRTATVAKIHLIHHPAVSLQKST